MAFTCWICLSDFWARRLIQKMMRWCFRRRRMRNSDLSSDDYRNFNSGSARCGWRWLVCSWHFSRCSICLYSGPSCLCISFCSSSWPWSSKSCTCWSIDMSLSHLGNRRTAKFRRLTQTRWGIRRRRWRKRRLSSEPMQICKSISYHERKIYTKLDAAIVRLIRQDSTLQFLTGWKLCMRTKCVINIQPMRKSQHGFWFEMVYNTIHAIFSFFSSWARGLLSSLLSVMWVRQSPSQTSWCVR